MRVRSRQGVRYYQHRVRRNVGQQQFYSTHLGREQAPRCPEGEQSRGSAFRRLGIGTDGGGVPQGAAGADEPELTRIRLRGPLVAG